MRILIVMGGYFPGKKYGGPPVSVDNFCSLMKDCECFIVTVNHDLLEIEPYKGISEGWNNRGNCKVLYLSDKEYRKSTFEKVIEEIRPDLLYLQGLFQKCVLPCLRLAQKYSLSVLMAPRGELCTGAINIKKYKKIPYIEIIRMLGLVKSIHWQSTSHEETEGIKKWMKANDSRVHELDNVPSIPKRTFIRGSKISGEGRFVFLSRIHPKKNLLNAIKFFHGATGKASFDIYGPIEDEEYWNQCEDEINRLPDNVKVEYRGLVDHDHVHEVFSKYDAFIFPTLSENYGHVIAESLIVGTSVIISDQTPWKRLEEAGVGWDIPLGEVRKFVDAINVVIWNAQNDANVACQKTIAFINNKLNFLGLKKQYVSVLSRIVQE